MRTPKETIIEIKELQILKAAELIVQKAEAKPKILTEEDI